MAKKAVVFLLILSVGFNLSFVYAHEGHGTAHRPDAGITPANPFFFFDQLFEKIALFFTFDEEAKAEKHLEHAKERLAEAQFLSEEDDVDEADIRRATELFKEQFNKAEELAQKTDSDEIKSKIVEATDANVTTLRNVLEHASEDAKDVIDNIIKESQRTQEQILENAPNVNSPN